MSPTPACLHHPRERRRNKRERRKERKKDISHRANSGPDSHLALQRRPRPRAQIRQINHRAIKIKSPSQRQDPVNRSAKCDPDGQPSTLDNEQGGKEERKKDGKKEKNNIIPNVTGHRKEGAEMRRRERKREREAEKGGKETASERKRKRRRAARGSCRRGGGGLTKGGGKGEHVPCPTWPAFLIGIRRDTPIPMSCISPSLPPPPPSPPHTKSLCHVLLSVPMSCNRPFKPF